MASKTKDSLLKHTSLKHTTNDTKLPVIALIGMPNSGKTTLFNALTGSNFKTSNYPGATVEYSIGRLVSGYGFGSYVMDSPGIISLNPSSPDEDVTISGLFNHPKFGLPDVVIVSCDCTQLSRQLFLVKQVIDTGFKTIVALTMNDLLDKKELYVSEEKLGKILNAPVIKINSKKKEGLEDLIRKAEELYVDDSIKDYKTTIRKPSHPAEEDIAKLYDYTEATEREVLESKDRNLDINEVNRKAFRSLSRTPDLNSMKLDRVFLHPIWGILIFVVSM
ncbi:MAG: ferrous iron transporter B, partial [Ignavibacteria bacterium]|nr:ferrous iron transporter B [Ignavibacteria bacterium]